MRLNPDPLFEDIRPWIIGACFAAACLLAIKPACGVFLKMIGTI